MMRDIDSPQIAAMLKRLDEVSDEDLGGKKEFYRRELTAALVAGNGLTLLIVDPN